MNLRLAIDLDGVVADFNRGWTSAYNHRFGGQLAAEMVESWDGPLALTHFEDMSAFWAWARDVDGQSVFRHLEPYPEALEALGRLDRDGHRVVIVSAKPDWAIPDTLAWLAQHRIPTREVHFTESKFEVDADVYLDDAPAQLQELTRHRGASAAVCRYVRPWNDPVEGAHDIHGWSDLFALVRRLHEMPVG